MADNSQPRLANPFESINMDTMFHESVATVLADSTRVADLVQVLLKPLQDAIKESLIQAVTKALTHTFQETIAKLQARILKLEEKHQENADFAETQEQYSRRNCLFFLASQRIPVKTQTVSYRTFAPTSSR